jgi:hypothetical protein
MPNQKSQASSRPQQTASHRTNPDNAAREHDERDEANKRRFVDQSGVVAQDLPDGQHGQNAVPDVNELKRTLPQEHGGADGDEGGLRAQMTVGDADKHGGRKRN